MAQNSLRYICSRIHTHMYFTFSVHYPVYLHITPAPASSCLQWYPAILQLVLERLTKEQKAIEIRLLCEVVVLSAIYCNPPLTLNLMEQIHFPDCPEAITEQFFTRLLEDAERFEGYGTHTLLHTHTSTCIRAVTHIVTHAHNTHTHRQCIHTGSPAQITLTCTCMCVVFLYNIICAYVHTYVYYAPLLSPPLPVQYPRP